MDANISQAAKVTTVALLITALACILYVSRSAILLTFIGIGIGALCSPVFNQLRSRFRIPRSLSALILFLLICGILGGTVVGLSLMVSDQVTKLTSRTPEIINNLQERLEGLLREYPWMREQVQRFNLTATLQKGFQGFFAGAYTGVIAVGGFIFALILGLYTAINSRYYFDATVRAFPRSSREKVAGVLARCGQVLRQWFRAQLIDMAIIGGLTAFGLWLIDVDYWAIFGLLTAILGIIPYVGTFLVVIAASLITVASDPSQVPAVVLVFFITQQIEGNLVLPWVMKDAAELPEVPLLIFMLLLGSWFGLIGIFAAPPIFAVLRTIYLMIYLPRMDANGAEISKIPPKKRPAASPVASH